MVFIVSLFLIWIFAIMLLSVNYQSIVNRWTSVIAILIIPTALCKWLFKFSHPVFDANCWWEYHFMVTVSGLILYGCWLIYGFFQNKAKVDRKRPRYGENFLNGATVLRHALKNELAKISLCSRNIEASAPQFDFKTFQKYIGENIGNIQISAGYLLKIIKKINDFTGDITLVKDYANLFDIIEQAVQLVNVYLQAKQVILKRDYSLVNMNFFCIAIQSI